jgi:hypothetical protein
MAPLLPLPLLLLLPLLLPRASAQRIGPAVLNVTLGNTTTPLYGPHDPMWLSVNLDTASLYKRIDLRDPVLIKLTKQLSPNLLRVGGTAATTMRWSGNTTPCQYLCLRQWLDVLYFINATDSTLLFTFNPWTRNNSYTDGSFAAPWTPGEAEPLIREAVRAGYGPMLRTARWQIGNEIGTSNYSDGYQLGLDFLTLKAMVRKYGVGDLIIGPSAGGIATDFANGYLTALGDQLEYFAWHTYALDVTTQCSVPWFTNLVKMVAVGGNVPSFRRMVQQYGRINSTKLYMEETASAPLGGCPGLSASFVSGFIYMGTLIQCGVQGAHMVGRHNIVGWSFTERMSQYMLAGPPGWVNSSMGAPRPHPDYYTHVLWKQLVGTTVLHTIFNYNNFNFSGSYWCGTDPAGGVVMAYANAYANPVTVNPQRIVGSAAQAFSSARTEWILTSSAVEYTDMGTWFGVFPPMIANDTIFLNGVELFVNSDGSLPQYPIPGRAMPATSALVVPAFSYGFIRFEDVVTNGACVTPSPTGSPTMAPTAGPSDAPTYGPNDPTPLPTSTPTATPTTARPTPVPTTAAPTRLPTFAPTIIPPATPLIAVNSGGAGFSDSRGASHCTAAHAWHALISSISAGVTWMNDTYFLNGTTNRAASAVIGGAGDRLTLYQSNRAWSSISSVNCITGACVPRVTCVRVRERVLADCRVWCAQCTPCP